MPKENNIEQKKYKNTIDFILHWLSTAMRGATPKSSLNTQQDPIGEN